MNPPRVRAYIELIIASAIWGIAGPVIKYTLGGLDPLIFLTYRFGLSTIVAIFTFLILGVNLPKDKKTFWELMLFGFLTSTVSLGLLFFGLKNTTVLDMSLIALTAPILISITGVIFLKEHITKREKIGMGIALIGTALTVLEPTIQNGDGATRIAGNIMILGSLLASAWVAVLAKKLLRAGVPPLTMTNFSFIIGFISLIPFALTKINASSFQIPVSYHLGVIYMALISGCLAYFLSNKAQKTIEIGEASLFAYLYPLFSTPLAVLWLGEKITPIFIVGALIITIGVAIAEIKKKRYN